ncbi:MAG TPA: hypothetical protein VL354_12555 [Spirochaetia bacterium]|nr:hypothetical protein [Spirochaetia bacterium]
MRKKPSQRDWLPLSRPQKVAAELPTGEAFRPEWIDFERGIRVGNLEPHERITQILKYGLEQKYGTAFVTDRWGRGVFWQWICWVPRADREAKPISHDVNFGCAKFFISADKEKSVFQAGLQVERGSIREDPEIPGTLQKDWDWHRLMRQCGDGTVLDREMTRLVRRDGFTARLIGGVTSAFTASTWESSRQIRQAARKALPDQWTGFQLFYPMSAEEVRSCSGHELVLATLGVFAEVTEAMNQCMQITLKAKESPPSFGPA